MQSSLSSTWERAEFSLFGAGMPATLAGTATTLAGTAPTLAGMATTLAGTAPTLAGAAASLASTRHLSQTFSLLFFPSFSRTGGALAAVSRSDAFG